MLNLWALLNLFIEMKFTIDLTENMERMILLMPIMQNFHLNVIECGSPCLEI